jgi:hypothetical protein
MTVVSAGGLLTNLGQAGGIAFGHNAKVYVAAVDANPDVETGLIARIDPNDGSQTLVS